MGDGEETERRAAERKQADGGARGGAEGGGGRGWGLRGGSRRGDTPTDDRLMNLWMKSAGAVLWAAADNNKR